MASPTSSSATAAASAAPPAPDPPSSSSHPLPQPRPYASPTLRPPPPLFSPQPLLGKPLNPPPPPPTQGFLYRHRAALPGIHPVRSSQAASVMAFAAVPQARPFVYGPADPMVTQMHLPVHHLRPPTAPLSQQLASTLMVPRPVVATTGPAKSVQPTVTPHPSVSSIADDTNFRKRERSREDDTVVINDRKVKLLDGCSSLYSLCRSWVRNGQPHEIQVLTNFGDAEKLLPRPLPASMVDSEVNTLHENDTEADDAKEDEVVGSIEELPMEDLLQRHVNHAKSVRARLRKERLRRIQRCKQRLALLLPPPSELGKTEITP